VHSFILPQWGGVIIYNPPSQSRESFTLTTKDLSATFATFHTQLLTLVGVAKLPPILSMPFSPGTPLTKWQLDALMRRRAQENTNLAVDTMSSIVKLVDQIDNMPVGLDVKGDVQDALGALDNVYGTAGQSPSGALNFSAQALSLSSRAFFNPKMLALLYFPAEHTYAVYTPLFAPVAVPLILSVLREFRRRRKSAKHKLEPRPKDE